MGVELTYVDRWQDVEDLFSWLGTRRREFLAIDVETSGLDPHCDVLRLVQFGDESRAFALDAREWLGVVREVLHRWDGALVAHNFGFEGAFLKRAGLDVPWHRLHCTMAMTHLLEPDKPKSLDSLSTRLLGDPKAGEAAILQADMTANGWTWATVPTNRETYWVYATLDTVRTARCANILWPQVRAAFGGIYDIEQASTHVVTDMTRRGVRVDVAYCERTLEAWVARIAQLTGWCHEACAIENPLSDAQVIRYLEAQGVTLRKRTPSGRASIDKDVLATIDHPVAAVVLELRQLTKFSATYLEQLIETRDTDDRVHARVHPQGARTGRMSVTDPPLQTLPRGPEIRDAFVPSEGHVLLLADMDQIELRLMAHFSADDAMCAAVREGLDLHTFTASRVYGVPMTQVRRQQRQLAKNAGFALIYGSGVRKFALTAGVTEAEGRTFMDAYHVAFPGVRRFQRALAQEAEGTGTIYTPMGRRHPIDEGYEYKATNYMIQGHAADYLKRIIIELDIRGLANYAILPIHDEIVFEVPINEVDEFEQEAINAMSDVRDHLVPLTAGASRVNRWGDKYREEGTFYPAGASTSYDPIPEKI